jgi:hypothetical protein
VIAVLLKDLMNSFILEKEYRPFHSNELLDFIQKKYIQEELSIVQYKKLFSELDKLDAEKPQTYIMNSIFLHDSISVPS